MLAKNENLAEFDLSTFVFDIGKMVALLATKVVIEKSHGERLLWNRN